MLPHMPLPHQILERDIEQRLAELRRFPADSLEALQVRNVLSDLVEQGDYRLRITRPEVTGRLRGLVERARREAVMSAGRSRRPPSPATVPGAAPGAAPGTAPAADPAAAVLATMAPGREAQKEQAVRRLLSELRRLKASTDPRDVSKRENLVARAQRVVERLRAASPEDPRQYAQMLQRQIDLMPRVAGAVLETAEQAVGNAMTAQSGGAAAGAVIGGLVLLALVMAALRRR